MIPPWGVVLTLHLLAATPAPHPSPAIVTRHAPAEAPATAKPSPGTLRGVASWMPERYGARYLALPDGRGHRVRICGKGGCMTMTSNDAGPSKRMQRRGRIADIGVLAWERICGVPRSVGLCRITVERL